MCSRFGPEGILLGWQEFLRTGSAGREQAQKHQGEVERNGLAVWFESG